MKPANCIIFIMCLAFTLPALAMGADEPVRLLWLGSSSTYFHHMPRQMADWLAARGDREAVSDLAGRSGTGVQKYLEPGFKAEYGLGEGETVLDKIAGGGYDFVVLQIPCDFLVGAQGNDGEALSRSIDTYCQAARAAGAEPILYEQGWGDTHDFELGQALLREAAKRNRVRIAPCRAAWEMVRLENPALELHDLPDRVHPGMVGTYLNLCCLYAALTGESPVGLPFREISYWPIMTRNGEKRRNRGGAFFTANEALAAYLQHTAWRACREAAEELGYD